MTALAEAPAGSVWNGMPGWGIAADLTPPELLQARHIKFLRKMIGAALILVVLLCIGGYVLAMTKHSSAESGLSAANDRTTQLTVEEGRYVGVTQLQSQAQSINSQLGTLMANEVDLAAVLGKLRGALPGSMSLTTMNVTLDSVPVPAAPGGSLDTSGNAQVGTVTLGGQAQSMDDVAQYVTVLSATSGVVNVVPTTNTKILGRATSWQITLQLSDVLLTHRFDTPATSPASPSATTTAAATGGN